MPRKAPAPGQTAKAQSSNRITALTPKPRDPSLVDVRVDGQHVGTALRSAIEELKLREGGPISVTTRRRLLAACERTAARTVALKTLGRSDQSREKLARLLIERHAIAEDAANAALDELKADGWQDDRRYAEARARTLAEERGCSHAFIALTLTDEGIETKLAATIARAAAPAAKDRQRAETLAQSALETIKRTATPNRRRGTKVAAAASDLLKHARRISQLLARRGFDADTIGDVLERLGLVSAFER